MLTVLDVVLTSSLSAYAYPPSFLQNCLQQFSHLNIMSHIFHFWLALGFLTPMTLMLTSPFCCLLLFVLQLTHRKDSFFTQFVKGVEQFVENSDVFPLPSFLHYPISSSPLCQVSILRSTNIILSPTTEMDVALQFRGFIHPLWGAPPPAPAPTETVSMWARIQRLHFEARMASGPNSSQLVRESAFQNFNIFC